MARTTRNKSRSRSKFRYLRKTQLRRNSKQTQTNRNAKRSKSNKKSRKSRKTKLQKGGGICGTLLGKGGLEERHFRLFKNSEKTKLYIHYVGKKGSRTFEITSLRVIIEEPFEIYEVLESFEDVTNLIEIMSETRKKCPVDEGKTRLRLLIPKEEDEERAPLINSNRNEHSINSIKKVVETFFDVNYQGEFASKRIYLQQQNTLRDHQDEYYTVFITEDDSFYLSFYERVPLGNMMKKGNFLVKIQFNPENIKQAEFDKDSLLEYARNKNINIILDDLKDLKGFQNLLELSRKAKGIKPKIEEYRLQPAAERINPSEANSGPTHMRINPH